MSKLIDDFAILIMSHGRAGNVKTFDSLRFSGYTGPIFIVCDDSDSQIDAYIAEFGEDNVKVFSKKDYFGKFDLVDNRPDLKGLVFARHACHDIAKELGIKYFGMFDDDYMYWAFKTIDESNVLRAKRIMDLDSVFEAMLKFMLDANLDTVAMGQGGDYLGGSGNGQVQRGFSRKAMNTFLVRTDRPLDFMGRLNEDVNAYVFGSPRGRTYFTAFKVSTTQAQTQASSGGLTDEYLKSGTYVKSFYSVVIAPSFVKVKMMGTRNPRVHHAITWNNAAPKIVDESLRKE